MPLLDQPDTPELVEYLLAPSGGMITNLEPHLLQPTQCASLLNADLSVQGVRQKRLGVRSLGSPVPGLTDYENTGVVGAYEIPEAGNPQLLLYRSGNYIWAKTTDFDTYEWKNYLSTGSSAVSPINSPQYCSTVFKSFLYIYSPMEASGATLGDFNSPIKVGRVPASGATYMGLSSVYGARHFLPYVGRLWAIDNQRLGWSLITGDVLVPPDMRDSVSSNFKFSDNDENIAIFPLRESTPRILIFRKKSIWLLDVYFTTYGYYPGAGATSNTLDYTKAIIRPIVEDVGCVGTRAVCWVPRGGQQGDYLFLSWDGIRSLQRSMSDTQGGPGLPLSYRIQPTIDRINWEYARFSIAAHNNGIVYFCVPVDGSTVPNFTIWYDVNRDAFGTMDLAISSIVKANFYDEAPALYFCQSTCMTDYPLSDGLSTHLYKLCQNPSEPGFDQGYKDPGYSTPVKYDEITRALVFDTKGPAGSGANFLKRWGRTELTFRSDSTCATLALSYRVDDCSSWTRLANLFLPANQPGTVQFQYVLHNIPPGRKLQFRLQDECSFARWKLIDWFATALPQNQLFSE